MQYIKNIAGNKGINNQDFFKQIRKFVNVNSLSRPQYPVMTGDEIDNYKISDIIQ